MKTSIALSLLLFILFASCEREESFSLAKETFFHAPQKYTAKRLDTDPAAKQLIDDVTIYEFINSFIAADTMYLKRCNTIVGRHHLPMFMDKSDSLQISNTDTLFTKRDVDFIFKQARYSQLFKVDQRKLTQKKHVILPEICEVFGDDHSEYWDNVHKQYGALCFVSMPLFSLDRKTALIGISYSNSIFNGFGGRYIYRKVKGKWVLIASLSEWVS